ncbi:MAG: hypothetical protein P8168_09605 [Deltaproteobacteria bacterium]
MRRKVFVALLGLMVAGVSWAWGQPGHHACGHGFHSRLLELKRSQLGPALGVNQQTVNKLLAIDRRYQPMRHRLILEMKADLRRLKNLVSQSAPPEKEIETVLSNMKNRRLEMLNLQQRKDDEETAILTPVQQARYIIYLMGLIREARSIRGGHRGGPEGPAPLRPPREIPVSRPPR